MGDAGHLVDVACNAIDDGKAALVRTLLGVPVELLQQRPYPTDSGLWIWAAHTT